MKVLIIAKTHTPWQNGILIYQEAIRQGKDVELVGLQDVSSGVFNKIESYKPDWIFLTGMRSLARGNMQNLKDRAKLMVWDADAVNTERTKIWNDVSGIPDLAVNSTMDVVNRFKGQAKDLRFVPQYYDNVYYNYTIDRLSDEHEIYDVTFMGDSYGSELRERWLRHLLSEGLKVKLCGLHRGLSLPDSQCFSTEMANVYRQSKIVIDIKREYFDYGDFVTSDRIFKALGCGAFFLTFDIPKLESVFDKRVHLDVYGDTYTRMLSKIKYYLNNEQERESIALEGKKEVMAKHLLKHRVSQYWELMESAL